MFAGMESSQIFHEKREALIEKKYNADAIQQRIHMGVQESQNCTVITMRMKHRRMRWFNLSCPNERGGRNIKCSKSTKKRRKGKVWKRWGKKRINKKWIKRYGYKKVIVNSKGWNVKTYTDGTVEFVE